MNGQAAKQGFVALQQFFQRVQQQAFAKPARWGREVIFVLAEQALNFAADLSSVYLDAREIGYPKMLI